MFSAGHLLQYGPLGLFLVSFFESTVFPIPPDVLLLPLCLMSPRLSWWYAFLTTAASVLGALAGYAIGRKAGRPALRRFFSEDVIRQVEVLFGKYGGWAVGIAAFTPVPYKVFTFGAGIFHVPLLTFTTVSIAGRAGRFFLEGVLVYFLGNKAQAYLGANFEIATLVLTAVLLLATWLLPKALPSGRRAVLWQGRESAQGQEQVWAHERTQGREREEGQRRPWEVRAYLHYLRSLGAGFLAWTTLTALLAVFALAFLEDVAGPEREILDATLGPVFDKLLFVNAMPGFWRETGGPLAMALLPIAGILAYLRAGRRTPSASYRLLVWLIPLGVMAYAVERGTALYLSRVYGRTFAMPGGGPLLAPFFLVLGLYLIARPHSAAWRLAALAAGGGAAAGQAGYAVLLGGLDPAAGAMSLIASAFTFCLTMSVLTALSPRNSRGPGPAGPLAGQGHL